MRRGRPTTAEPRHLQTLAHVCRSEESTGDEKLVSAAFNAGYVALVSRPGKLKVESGKMQSYVEERDGGYYIADTRISLDSIVHAFQAGESPEGILRSFPLAGPLVRIYGAITFYLENKEKVEAYLKDQDRRWEELARIQAKSTAPLATRLREAKEQALQGRR